MSQERRKTIIKELARELDLPEELISKVVQSQTDLILNTITMYRAEEDGDVEIKLPKLGKFLTIKNKIGKIKEYLKEHRTIHLDKPDGNI